MDFGPLGVPGQVVVLVMELEKNNAKEQVLLLKIAENPILEQKPPKREIVDLKVAQAVCIISFQKHLPRYSYC